MVDAPTRSVRDEIRRKRDVFLRAAPGKRAIRVRLVPSLRPGFAFPIVMLHGGSHTGACYLETPDGREGWAPLFARHGFDAYVVDWPGRNGGTDESELAGISTREMAEAILHLVRSVGPTVLMSHSASGPMAWWIAEQAPDHVAAVVGLAPGGPANILPVLPDDADAVFALRDDESLGCPVMVPEHSPVVVDEGFIRTYWANAPRFPRQAMERYVGSIVPESARLFNERFNIGGRGLRVENPATVASIPSAILTGDHDPRHPIEVDRATAAFVGADFLWLPDLGHAGNGHMLMIETNNAAIATVALDWLERQGLPEPM